MSTQVVLVYKWYSSGTRSKYRAQIAGRRIGTKPEFQVFEQFEHIAFPNKNHNPHNPLKTMNSLGYELT